MSDYARHLIEEVKTGYSITVDIYRGTWWRGDRGHNNMNMNVTIDIIGKQRNAQFNDALQRSGSEIAKVMRRDDGADACKIRYMSGNKTRYDWVYIFNGGATSDADVMNQILEYWGQYRRNMPSYVVVPVGLVKQITVYVDGVAILNEAAFDLNKWAMWQLYDLLDEAGIRRRAGRQE